MELNVLFLFIFDLKKTLIRRQTGKQIPDSQFFFLARPDQMKPPIDINESGTSSAIYQVLFWYFVPSIASKLLARLIKRTTGRKIDEKVSPPLTPVPIRVNLYRLSPLIDPIHSLPHTTKLLPYSTIIMIFRDVECEWECTDGGDQVIVSPIVTYPSSR
jgi:hypothetical protein